ncbi:hypothetical protein AAG906_027207 [Vitis piasezkii]
MRSTHRDALIQAWSQIRVKTTTTPEGLIHMMIVGKATSIVFSYDDLPLEDNGSALNIYPLATFISIGYAPSKFVPFTQTIREYNSTKRKVIGTLEIELLIGQPWIHKAGAISSILHQNVKFIHDGKVITVHSIGDMFASLSPCFKSAITHSRGIVSGLGVVQEVELQHIVHKLCIGHSTSLDHMSLLTLYFMEEVYIDEILVMGMSQIDGIIWLSLFHQLIS